MDDLEKTRQELDSLYSTWHRSHWIVERIGSAWLPLSLACIPLIYWWTPKNASLALALSLASAFYFYIYSKYKKVRAATLHRINIIEAAIKDQHNLCYCGCDVLSHYFCPTEEKLWSTTSLILFDYHPHSRYIKWHNSIHDPDGGSPLGNALAAILIVALTVIALLWKT